MSRIRFRHKQLLLAGSIGGASILLICVIAGYFIFKHIDNKNETEKTVIEQERDYAKNN